MALQWVIASPFVGWEEKQLLRAAERAGIRVAHLPVASFCSVVLDAQRSRAIPSILDARPSVMMRCPSYFLSIELAAALERQGLRTYNTCEQLTLFGRKTSTDAWLAARGLPTIPSCVAFAADNLDAIVELLGLPLVMKPSIGGYGRRVHLVESARELRQLWDHVADFAPAHQRVLYVQRCIRVAHDVRVNLLDGRAVVAMERVNDAGFSKNVAQGAEVRRFELSGRAAEVIGALAHELPRGFFGVDVLIDAEGDVFVCEVNAVCEFRASSSVSELDLAAEVVRSVTHELAP